MLYKILIILVHYAAAAAKSFSCVRLCVTPETAAQPAPLSLGFSRQEHWSGLPFLLQCMKVKSDSEATQSCPTISDPMDCSLPGFYINGIFQARVLEWVAIAFSWFIMTRPHFLSASKTEKRNTL